MRRAGAAKAVALRLWDWPASIPKLALLGFLFAAILVSRHPAVLLRADFWGEDGWLWYPDAYNHGWASLLLPHTGYLQTISRLGGLLARPFPLAWAPTLFAAIALVVQILPPLFLVSSRMEDAWPHAGARLAFALVYLGLPNSYEVFVNLTNAQWHLAVLAFLVLTSRAPSGWAGRAFDAAVLLLSGLSGPFCLLLLPIALWQLVETRSNAARWRLFLVVAPALVQLACLLGTIDTRAAAPLGAGPGRFARIVALNIVLAVLLGQHMLPRILALQSWQASSLPAIGVTAFGLMLGVVAWRSGQGLLRKGCLFAALAFAAALARPQVSLTEPQWIPMTFSGWGDRYYIFPMLAWTGVLFALAGARGRVARYLGAALLASMLVAIAGDWRYPRMAPTDFAQKAREFQQATPGTVVRLQIHPPPNVMWLTKRPD